MTLMAADSDFRAVRKFESANFTDSPRFGFPANSDFRAIRKSESARRVFTDSPPSFTAAAADASATAARRCHNDPARRNTPTVMRTPRLARDWHATRRVARADSAE